MKIYANADEAKEILVRGKFDDAAKVAAVKEIVRDVQKRGDKALFAYEEKFDGSVLTADTVRVSEKEYQNAYKEVSEDFLVSLKKAVKNVYDYHARQSLAIGYPHRKRQNDGLCCASRAAGGHLRARRHGAPVQFCFNGRPSRESGGRKGNLRGYASQRRQGRSRRAGGGKGMRRHRAVQSGRRAGDRRARLRHGKHSQGGRHRGSGQYLRHAREKGSVR